MEDVETLKITETYLGELIDFCTRKTIGKILKKVDILSDRDILKKIIKESIYEEFRELKYLIQAYNRGEELIFHQFKVVSKAE